MSSRWNCPICGRHFSRKNQQHSCEMYSIEHHHYKKGKQEAINLYEYLMERIQEFGPIHIEPMKSIIALKKKSQFCSVQIQQKALKIIFRLFSPLSSSRFHSSSQQADGMHYYQLKIQEIENIDQEFLEWLHLAYQEN